MEGEGGEEEGEGGRERMRSSDGNGLDIETSKPMPSNIPQSVGHTF